MISIKTSISKASKTRNNTKDAEKLIELKSYDHALAFCILDEEELVKSLLFLLASYDLIPKEDMVLLQKQISTSRRHI